MKKIIFFLSAVFVIAGSPTVGFGADPTPLEACRHTGLHRPGAALFCVTLVQQYEELTADKISACEQDTDFWDALDYCFTAATSKYVTKEKITACSETTTLKSSFEKCLDGAGYYAVSADDLRSCHYAVFYKDCIDKLTSGGSSGGGGGTH